MAKIDVIASAAEVQASRVEGRAVAVIDVFRATSVMCAALNNGARRIIPLTDVEACHSMQSKIQNTAPSEKILLGGERLTYIIEGFDLDNSPLAYTRDIVEGSTIILSTTNGTRTINAAFDASRIFIASLLNGTAVAEKLAATGLDVTIICAGRDNRFTMEDGLCAGMIASHLLKNGGHELSDYAWTMADLYERYKEELLTPLKHCTHYNNIRTRLQGDIAYSLQRDIMTITPEIKKDGTHGYQEIFIGN